MEQRVSVVTLGVADLDRSRRFYEALGWQRGNTDAPIVFFQLLGAVLALYSRSALAEEAGIRPAEGSGFGGITLACNVRSKAEVDAVMAQAVAAGAKVLRPAGEMFWGGYSGYFADPDGHPWEVAWNPGWSMDEAGRVSLSP